MKKVLTAILLIIASTCYAAPQKLILSDCSNDNLTVYHANLNITNKIEDKVYGIHEVIFPDGSVTVMNIILSKKHEIKKCWIIFNDNNPSELTELEYIEEIKSYMFCKTEHLKVGKNFIISITVHEDAFEFENCFSVFLQLSLSH